VKQFLRFLVLLLVYLLGAPAAILVAYRVRKQQAAQIPGPRILLLRPDHLGDLVLTTPVLAALKSALPQAHITMMVGPWSSGIVARHPAIDRVITCPFPGFRRATQGLFAPYTLLLQTAQQLRREHYDLAINLRPDFWWGAALLYSAHIPRRVGYALAPGKPFLTHTLPFASPEHATLSNLRLLSAGLQALGHNPLPEPYTPERYPLQFIPTQQERQAARQRLQQVGVDDETPVVVIHPGSGAAVKLWRAEAWAACANKLLALTFPDPMQIVLTGTKSESSLLGEIAQRMITPPVLITDMSVGQLAALLNQAHLVMGVDSGPLHLAVAQHTRTLHIFGPTDARIFGPWGNPQRHSVITSIHRCPSCPAIPCGRLDFSPEAVAAHPCVRRVTEKQVERAMLTLLDMTDETEKQYDMLHENNREVTPSYDTSNRTTE
jgi:ADP-heptose:LPS heptosyltransferase